jgi:hypothetical protein
MHKGFDGLYVEPARHFVQVIKREKRVCRGCEHRTVTMPAPVQFVVDGFQGEAHRHDATIMPYGAHGLLTQRCP